MFYSIRKPGQRNSGTKYANFFAGKVRMTPVDYNW